MTSILLVLDEITIMGMGNGAEEQEKAAREGHRQYMEATDKAIDFAKEQAQKGREDIEKYQGIGNEFLDPFSKAGRKALDMWMAASGMDPNVSKEEIYEKFRNSPGYQFALDEGNKAISRNAAARGTAQSGALQKELLKYGQGMADQQYDTWLNRIAQTLGMGANADAAKANNAWNTGNNLANMGTNLANNVGNMYAGQGASAANSEMAAANAKASSNSGMWNGIGSALGAAAGFMLGGGPTGAAAGAQAGGAIGRGIGGR